MESGCEQALVNYLKTFNLSSDVYIYDDLYNAEALLEFTQIVCGQNNDNPGIQKSQIEGFESILKTLYLYYKDNHDIGISKKRLSINPYDIVHFKNEEQLYVVIKLIIGVIIKEQKEEWINNMMTLEEEEAVLMQTIWEQSMELMENLPKASELDESSEMDLFNGSSGVDEGSGIADQQSLDKIIELNMHISTLQSEKQRMKAELSEEK